jgi:uncharacterized protein
MQNSSPTSSSITHHSLLESLLYHLLPGVLIGLVYYLTAPLVVLAGYPSVMALNLTATLVLVPVEMGLMLRLGKKQTGHWTLKGVLAYQRKLRWWQYLIWVPVIFAASGLIMTAFNPVNAWLESGFAWMPDGLKVGMGLAGGLTRSKLIQTYILFFLFVVVLAPTVEELVFRGFLLPRMPEKLGKTAPFFHSLLFALYHVWSPWMFLARTFALLPLVFVVRWKRDLYLGVGEHILINSLDFIMAVMLIAGMR